MVQVTVNVFNCSECPYHWKSRNSFVKDSLVEDNAFDYFCGECDDEIISLAVCSDEKDIYLIPPLWCPYRKENKYV